MKTVFTMIMLFLLPLLGQKMYLKNYFESGSMKSEGWMTESQKTDYWYYYYENGNKKQEGHYVANKKADWWLFYNINGRISKKVEFKNNLQEGLCLIYKNGELIKAEQYKAGVKINEWTTLSDYRKDNPL